MPERRPLSQPPDTVTRDATDASTDAEACADRRRIGRFEIVGILGEGGMGRVYRAWDTQLQREVALKMLRHDGPRQKERLLREARAQARLDHPGICRVFDAGEMDGEPFIAMQCLSGQTLAETSETLNYQQKAEIILQAAEALHAAHREALIHRDVKPANILTARGADGRWQAWVTDFGLVRDLGEDGVTQTGILLGTRKYMAPEQLRGDPSAIDRRTDVYGLGATLYELLAGRAPHDGEAVDTGDPPLPRQIKADVPADLEAITMKCIEANLGRRYASANELAEDLRRYLEGMPVQARAVGAWYLGWRWAQRHRWPLAAAGLMLLLLSGAGLLYWQQQQQGRRVGELAERFISMLGRVEVQLIYVYMRQRHDVTAELDQVRGMLRDIEEEITKAGELALGPGMYALGRGELLLGNSAQAVQRLRAAWAAGYQRRDAAYALGRALMSEHERLVAEAGSIPDPQARRARLQQLEREYRGPVEEYLAQGAAAGDEIPPEVLLAANAGQPEAALQGLLKIKGRLHWPLEGDLLQARLEIQRGEQARERGAADEARGWYGKARQSLIRLEAPSYPERYDAECRLANAVLELESRRSGAVAQAYQNALTAANTYMELLPNGLEPLRYRRQARLIYAYERFANNAFAEELLDDVDADAQRALQLNSRHTQAYRDLATAWRIRAFAWGNFYTDDSNREKAFEACHEVEKWTSQIKGIEPLRAQDWHNLGAALRLFVELPLTDRNDVQKWRQTQQSAFNALDEALKIDDRHAAANKDLGYLHLREAILAFNTGADPSASIGNSLSYSLRAKELQPDYFDAWDNYAYALDMRAFLRFLRGEDPLPDFEAANAAWWEDIRLNRSRHYPYAYMVAYDLCLKAYIELHRNGDWAAVLNEGEEIWKQFESRNPKEASKPYYSRDKIYFSITKAHILLESCSNADDALQAISSQIAHIPDLIIERELRLLNAWNEIRKQTMSSGGAAVTIRNLFKRTGGADWAGLMQFNFRHALADLGEQLSRQGISPLPDIEMLEASLDEAVSRPLLQSALLFLAGRADLIRAEWLKRSKNAGWQIAAQHAVTLFDQAVQANRWFQHRIAPYRLKAIPLLEQSAQTTTTPKP